MGFQLSQRSQNNLAGVHPDLVRVVERAIQLSTVDFQVTCGLRTKAKQQELVDAGKSKTMNSRHLTGHAVDVVAIIGGRADWSWPNYLAIARAFKHAALELGVAIVWGGDWRTFKDGPHFELDRNVYPAPAQVIA